MSMDCRIVFQKFDPTAQIRSNIILIFQQYQKYKFYQKNSFPAAFTEVIFNIA